MAAVPIMVDGHRHCMHFELGRGSDYVESGLALDAYRLQGKRVVSTHEAIGAYAETYRRSSGNPAIYAGQRAGSHAWGWREDGPSQSDITAEADLSSDTVKSGLIVLDRTTGARGEDAIEGLIRYDDIARRH